MRVNKVAYVQKNSRHIFRAWETTICSEIIENIANYKCLPFALINKSFKILTKKRGHY